jgi:predicted RNase H-like nuclease
MARLDLFNGIVNRCLRNRYGLGVKAQFELCEDPSADHLDALLCAIQAAWAWQTGLDGFRNRIDPLEGWIAKPSPAFLIRMRSDVSPKFLEKG